MYTIKKESTLISGEFVQIDIVGNFPESKRVGACISMYGPSSGGQGVHIGVNGPKDVLALLNAIAVESNLIRDGERISIAAADGSDAIIANAQRTADQALLEVREIGRRLDNV